MGSLEKLRLLRKIISQNGGLFKSIYKLWRFDTLKDGKYMGCDSYGNRYYENPYYVIGSSRWVEYNDSVRIEYDASQVTPEWYGWLHYRTDRLPCEDEAKLFIKGCCWTQCWLQKHEENPSGTALAFYPYSTTRPHITIWDGIHFL
ncbi:unnamed protein product, partial [Iphiclides podalirius]